MRAFISLLSFFYFSFSLIPDILIIFRALRHPNVVNFMGICSQPDLCIITEYLSRGTLFDVICEMGPMIDQEDIRK